MLKWYEHEETAGDIVISSRIRLARNFNDYLFADKISEEDAAKMINSLAHNEPMDKVMMMAQAVSFELYNFINL